ncbi:Na/Pi cotransporter family protein [Coprococcus eutactus]|uniref:Na/Pi cotransporter family protein n=1 Tax=Coprococcus eutactus TaxID=33043 RepID=UPI00015E96F6|nr:Na/Pi cotransporter family protein [Coprococcus eutactus]EDP25753.1 Na/Pi-cotransporter II-like protein [Coprococcus eutactus ATCC 27759]UEA79114.1 Na/Pi cotransporter family protein [Coprococcus eutactus ATCC 27759]UWP16498.1 Na/Pi cotransporter family protein [Coprococcus eutactus]
MDERVKIVFGLLGGLAMFLYGMNSMSDALQKAAGERMKRILGFLTKNPLMGALAGALVTAVLQSSSATTVMVIGFVSAGLMSLPQAISVIFGANIGTTMTAQLMAFKISNYIYPIIFIGFIMNFVFKKEKIRNVGMVIFSFGLLFEGIEVMGGVMKPLASSAIFVDLMGKVSEIPVLGVVLGAVMTLVVQSSSATIAVLQNFASQPGPDGIHSVIGLAGAIPILFGDNIGTTITALLASIGQSKNAKRTAIAHSTFNITGTILFMFLIRPLAAFVQWISPKGDELDIISRQIANAHTTFNVACTLIWLPLIPVMVKIVKFIIRGEDKKNSEGFVAKYLDDKAMSQPAAAIYMAAKEISRLSAHAGKMIEAMKNAIEKRNITDIRDKYVDEHDKVKELQDIIVDFITKLISSGNLTEKQAEQAAGLVVVSNNIERIADRCDEVDGLYKKILDNGQLLSDAAITDLTACMDMTEKLFSESMNAIITGDSETPDKVAADKKKIRKLQRQAGKAHLARVKKNTCVRSLTADYSSLLYSMDRMADNCISIAEEAIDDFTFDKLDIENMDSDSEVMVKAGAQA